MNWIFGTTYLPKKIFYNLALISDYIFDFDNQKSKLGNPYLLTWYPCHRPFSLSIRRLEYYVTAHKLQAYSLHNREINSDGASSFFLFMLLCFYMINLILFLHIALGKSRENMGGFVRIRMLLVKVFHPIMHRVGYIFILLWPNEQSELNNGKTKLALISYQFDFRCVNKMSVTSTTIAFSYFF